MSQIDEPLRKSLLSKGFYHFIVVKTHKDKGDCTDVFFYNKDIILASGKMLNLVYRKDRVASLSVQEIQDIGKKIKSFLSDDIADTLLIGQHLFKMLIKQQNEVSFFKLIAKNNKNIVLFIEDGSGLEISTRIKSYRRIEMTDDEFNFCINFEREVEKTKLLFQQAVNSAFQAV